MIKRAKQTVSAGVQSDSAGSRAGESPYDMSMDQVPSGWVDAQSASPIRSVDNTPLSGRARFDAMPTGHESTFIPNIAAVAASFTAGVVWFLVDSQGIYNGPWIAIAVGAFIAAAIQLTRMGEGPYRAVLAMSSYLLTLLVVLIFVTHRDLTAVYGSGYSLRDYEDTLIRTRFQNAGHLIAYGLGAVVASVLAYTGRNQR